MLVFWHVCLSDDDGNWGMKECIDAVSWVSYQWYIVCMYEMEGWLHWGQVQTSDMWSQVLNKH